MNKLKGFIENNKGFTLIEVLIAISILGIVLAISTSMIIQAYRLVPSSTRRMSAKQMAEMHVTEIARHVRNAEDQEIKPATNTIEGTLTYDKDNKIIEITNNGDTRTFNNVVDFNIKEKNSSYKIILTKEVDGQEGEATAVVTPRNKKVEAG